MGTFSGAVTHAHQLQYEVLPYDSVASPSAVVQSGLARFTVLSKQLIRMEQSKQDCTCPASAPCQNLNDGSCDPRYSNIAPYGKCTSPTQKNCACSPGTSDCKLGHFEDRPTLAIVNRAVPVPPFTSSLSADNATLTIDTGAGGVKLQYVVGKAFAADTLSVTFEATARTRAAAAEAEGAAAPGAAPDAATTWRYGDADDGNLLGTIKSLDELGPISLNCTENAGTKVR